MCQAVKLAFLSFIDDYRTCTKSAATALQMERSFFRIGFAVSAMRRPGSPSIGGSFAWSWVISAITNSVATVCGNCESMLAPGTGFITHWPVKQSCCFFPVMTSERRTPTYPVQRNIGEIGKGGTKHEGPGER